MLPFDRRGSLAVGMGSRTSRLLRRFHRGWLCVHASHDSAVESRSFIDLPRVGLKLKPAQLALPRLLRRNIASISQPTRTAMPVIYIQSIRMIMAARLPYVAL